MGVARNFQHVRLIRGLSIVENVLIGVTPGWDEASRAMRQRCLAFLA